MDEGAPDSLLAFAELAAELLGRVISACMEYDPAPPRLNPLHKKVKIEFMQSSHRPDHLILRGANFQLLFFG